MLLCITRSGCVPPECPADYGYLEDPSYCELDVACRMCWDREIPGTENNEKENENMSDELIEKAYDEKYKHASASSHMFTATVPRKTKEATKKPYEDPEAKFYMIDSINYKEKYEEAQKEIESLKELISQKDIALLASMNQHQVDEEQNKSLRSERNMYRYGLHVVEAFLGTKILEDF